MKYEKQETSEEGTKSICPTGRCHFEGRFTGVGNFGVKAIKWVCLGQNGGAVNCQ